MNNIKKTKIVSIFNKVIQFFIHLNYKLYIMLYSFIEYVVSLPQEMDFEGGTLLCHSHTAK